MTLIVHISYISIHERVIIINHKNFNFMDEQSPKKKLLKV